jgi:hypothetical protein
LAGSDRGGLAQRNWHKCDAVVAVDRSSTSRGPKNPVLQIRHARCIRKVCDSMHSSPCPCLPAAFSLVTAAGQATHHLRMARHRTTAHRRGLAEMADLPAPSRAAAKARREQVAPTGRAASQAGQVVTHQVAARPGQAALWASQVDRWVARVDQAAQVSGPMAPQPERRHLDRGRMG